MKAKSILTKSIAVAALSSAGLAALNLGNVSEAHAAIVANDASVYHVSEATTVYNYYENGAATGQVLAANTNWKIIRTAYDTQGNKWYDLGKNQWVKVVKPAGNNAQKTTNYNQAATAAATNTLAQNQTKTYTKTYTTHYGHSTYVSHANYVAPVSSISSVASTGSVAGGSEASAKAWIASHESGGSYSARNGQYVGKYQLSAAYLHGDYSAANQERAANSYVQGRYGSWTAAKAFWQSHGWY